jgi:hypothetical protein
MNISILFLVYMLSIMTPTNKHKWDIQRANKRIGY